MKKTSQTSIDGTAPAKRGIDHKIGLYPWRDIPYTSQKGDEYALKLMAFVEDEKIYALRLSQFLREVKLSSHTLWTLMKISPKLRAAHSWALMVFGERRELGMLNGTLNSAGSIKILPRYCPEWNKQQINEAKLKAIASVIALKVAEGTLQKEDIELISRKYAELEEGGDSPDGEDLSGQVQAETIPGKTS